MSAEPGLPGRQTEPATPVAIITCRGCGTEYRVLLPNLLSPKWGCGKGGCHIADPFGKRAL